MPFKIVRNDITKMKVDVVVNTANQAPIYGPGVDVAIYKAAGEEELLAARREIGYMEEGQVAVTNGYKLPAKYIIHAVSPLYIDGESGEEEKLRQCYRRSLELAFEKDCKSIAFPLIATGGFGYPKEEGMRIAVDEINAFLLTHQMFIYLVVFDTASTELGLNLYPDLETYIDQNYVCEKREEEYGDRYFSSVLNVAPSCHVYRNRTDASKKKIQRRPLPKSRIEISEEKNELTEFLPRHYSASVCQSTPIIDCQNMSEKDYEEFIEEKDSALQERLQHLSDTFQEYLLYLIEKKGLSNVDVYKRAIIDKRQFSKIKNNPNYHPDKFTALRLCVGTMLNLDDTKDLLARAGYALSPCDKRDIIFSYFIEKEIYDAMEIDITLEEHGLEGFIV